MKTITVSDFRKDIKKYSELAESEKIIVNRGSGKAFLVVPINTMQDKGYSEEFVANLLAAEHQHSQAQIKRKIERFNERLGKWNEIRQRMQWC